MARVPQTLVRRTAAFTLIELLVVISIIGLMAAVGLPALKGFGKSNAVTAAQRQMLDDMNEARLRAIAEHTDVYVVFVAPSTQLNFDWTQPLTTAQLQQVTNVLKTQYTGYALYTPRSVGDQPGQRTGRYLSRWRTLPDGLFIRRTKFDYSFPSTASTNELVSQFRYDATRFPFPMVTNRTLALPYIQFDSFGRIVAPQDFGFEVIPLAQGFIEYGDSTAPLKVLSTQETPPNNSSTNSSAMDRIRIDGLTGRARVERYSLR